MVHKIEISASCDAAKAAYLVVFHAFFEKVFGAGDEIRTHDPNLGKVVLYP